MDFENFNWLMQLVSKFLLSRSFKRLVYTYPQSFGLIRQIVGLHGNMPTVFRGDTRKGITGKGWRFQGWELQKELEVMYDVVETRSGGDHDAI